MWIRDKFGNPINSEQLLSLYVESDPDDSAHYIVAANNSINSLVAQFTDGSSMTLAQAGALLDTLSELLGTHNPEV